MLNCQVMHTQVFYQPWIGHLMIMHPFVQINTFLLMPYKSLYWNKHYPFTCSFFLLWQFFMKKTFVWFIDILTTDYFHQTMMLLVAPWKGKPSYPLVPVVNGTLIHLFIKRRISGWHRANSNRLINYFHWHASQQELDLGIYHELGSSTIQPWMLNTSDIDA